MVLDTEDYTCAFCLNLLFEPCVAPCGHSFCKVCLLRCLSLGTPCSRRCPLCRRQLPRDTEGDFEQCTTLSKLLEASFPEAYAQRRSENAAEDRAMVHEGEGELPLFVLESMLPKQRRKLRTFEPQYRALVRYCSEAGRRFGMVGHNVRGGHHSHGVEVVMEECTPQPDGDFLVTVVGARAFRILEHWVQREGYLCARVAFLEEEEVREEEAADARELQRLVEDWEALVGTMEPRLFQMVRNTLGPMPPAERPGELALWTAALVNPQPPLDAAPAPEIRADVLAAEGNVERLRVVRCCLEASLSHLQVVRRSPSRLLVRRASRWVSQYHVPVCWLLCAFIVYLLSSSCPKGAVLPDERDLGWPSWIRSART